MSLSLEDITDEVGLLIADYLDLLLEKPFS